LFSFQVDGGPVLSISMRRFRGVPPLGLTGSGELRKADELYSVQPLYGDSLAATTTVLALQR
jgi:hypothetical protein